MKQLFQNLRTGKVELLEVPAPSPAAGELLIRSTRSLVSPGTERMLADFGKAGWVAKALKQPEKVRQVFDKLKTDGLEPTLRAVFSKLDQPLPLGYSNAGIVLATGQNVKGFAPGDRVISNGPHAEVVLVPENLCAKVPDEVDDDSACFTVVSAIALHSTRLLDCKLGESVCVLGLGLIGQLACQLLLAQGCRVIAFDLDDGRVEQVKRAGAHGFKLTDQRTAIDAALAFTGGNGVDAVLITASTASNQPIEMAPRLCRKRGKVVLVGVVGLELNRTDFYHKEISFQVSCSYGPGRYDEAYERRGLDYPLGYVRWTEQRNFEAVLQLLKDKKLDVSNLISKQVAFEDAVNEYDALLNSPAVLGAVFKYPEQVDTSHTVKAAKAPAQSVSPVEKVNVGFIGAGNFTASVLLPAFIKAGASVLGIASKTGASSAHLAKKFSIPLNTTDYRELLGAPDINTIVIATRHNLHASLVVEALEAGKHVFVEKPLALNLSELERVKAAHEAHPDKIIMVGFNRRFAPHTVTIKKLLKDRTEPICMVMTVNAGAIPAESWIQDPAVGGGRIIGEACHFMDLLRHIADSPIANVHATSISANAPVITSDKTTITLKFEDGSIGTIHYFANGHRAVSKERLEIFSQGRTIMLDNFRVIRAFGFPNLTHRRLWRQEKGHRQEVEAFMDALGTGEWQISWQEFAEISTTAIGLQFSA